MFDGKWRGGVDRATKPVGESLKRAGVTPNQLTLFGLLMSVGGAVAIGSGHLMWGVASLFATGLPDLFDGPLAKAQGSTSTRGAFLDSVADRVADAFLLGGFAWYLASRYDSHAALLALALLATTMLVSYERAKAESLGLAAKGGLMERAERFVALGFALILPSVMVPILWAILALTLLTAVARFASVWRQAPGPAVEVRRRRPATRTSTIVAWRERHGSGGPSRWRQRQREEMSTRVGRFAREGLGHFGRDGRERRDSRSGLGRFARDVRDGRRSERRRIARRIGKHSA